MDCVSFHPYAILDNSRPLSQQQARRDHLAFIKKKGGKAKLWNSESFWVIPDWMPSSNFKLRWEPENLARLLLVDMGEGLAGSTPTDLKQSLISRPVHPHINQDYGYGTSRRYPNAKFAVHAACAKFLAGAEPLYTPEPKNEATAYIFKNGDRLLSAVWNSRSKQKTELRLAIPEGATLAVYDVMGNLLKKYQKEVALPLSPRPYYMEWTGTTAEAVIKSFNNAVVTGENPIQIEGATILKKGDSTILRLDIKNIFGTTIQDAVISASSGAFTSPVKIHVKSLGDAQTGDLNVPVVLKNAEVSKADITITPEFANKKDLTVTASVKDVIEVNGVGEKFQINKLVYGTIDDAKDLSAEFTMKYKNQRILAIELTVKDSKRGAAAEFDHDQDCIELFLDKTPFLGGKRSYTQILIPVKEGKFWKMDAGGTITLSEDGYKARIYLCVRNPKYIGFDIGIDDSDGTKRETQIVWKGTKRNYKSNEGWALLELR